MTLVFQSSSQNSGVSVSNGDALVIRDFVDIFTAGTGVTLSAGAGLTSVLNHGDIYAYLTFNVNTNSSRVVNYGTASAIISAGNTGEAINLGGAGGLHTITNFGTITAQGDLIVTYESTGPQIITFTNHGVAETDRNILSATSLNLTVFDLNNSGYLKGGYLDMSATSWARLINTGTMHVDRIYMNSDFFPTLINHGVISGPFARSRIFMSDSQDFVINSGTMVATLDLGPEADRYEGIGAGVVTEGISGDGGNDTLAGGDVADLIDGRADQDKLVGRGGDDTLLGGAGFDTLVGGDGNDSMDGGNNHDTLIGNDGDDTLQGGFGNDVLVGQSGDDQMQGGPGNDTIDGGQGNDILEGGGDTDVLRGRAGEDDLTGGLGLDFLTGGPDADSFVFRSLAEAGIGATRDQILDFEKGLDVISVAGLSPGVFEFRGMAAFAPSGNPELRLVETANGSTIVQIDNNGDGVTDAEIRVGGVTGLTADDFVL
ncbi:calcium-binding protein [Antarctobacter sp.]|uniref:calcium-binding protein n=1 Tax=Antarctobacter sp. TaxID=1872577 RepID=UPI003A8CD292